MTDDLSQLATAYNRGTVKFDRLYDGLRVRLSPIASRYKLVGHDADDLIQISIISVYRSIGRYSDGTCFEAFAKTIAKRRIIDVIKAIRKSREPLGPQTDDLRARPYQSTTEHHPIWKLIIEEEIQRQAPNVAARRKDYTHDEIKAADYRDCARFVKRWREGGRRKTRRKHVDEKYKRRICRLSDGHVYDTIYDAAKANSNASKDTLLKAALYGYTCAKSKWRFA